MVFDLRFLYLYFLLKADVLLREELFFFLPHAFRVDVVDVLYQSIQLNAIKKKKENLKLSTILIEPKLNFTNMIAVI